jgi:hypothetical protein
MNLRDKSGRRKLILMIGTVTALMLGGCTGMDGSASSSAVSVTEFAASSANSAAAITGNRLYDGTYGIEAESDSSCFVIAMCNLSVQDGKMMTALTVKGNDYLYAFMGTPENAVTDEKNRIKAVTGNGTETFLVPIEALDMDIPCAVLKEDNKQWETVTLRFVSASLPAEALKNDNQKRISGLGLSDGEYMIGTKLSGGSGKASVASPAVLTISDGKASVKVEFSSPYFDYVLLNGEKYLPVSSTGNSVFEIPVDSLDYEMPITADTTAMSKSHEIQYTICFNSSTIQQVLDGGQE